MLNVVIAVIIVLVGFPFVIGPILIRFTHRQAAYPAFEEIKLVDFPGEAAEFLCPMTEAIEADGLTLIAGLRQSGQASNTTIYLTLLLNRPFGDMAMAVVITAQVGRTKRIQRYIEFCTRFTNGNEICTNNSPAIHPFKRLPEKSIFQFPDVPGPAKLYKIHRALLQRSTGVAEKRETATVDDLSRAMALDLEKQVGTGYLYLDETADVYRPTWMGACLMTWSLLWPVSFVLKLRRKSEARALLAELGV